MRTWHDLHERGFPAAKPVITEDNQRVSRIVLGVNRHGFVTDNGGHNVHNLRILEKLAKISVDYCGFALDDQVQLGHGSGMRKCIRSRHITVIGRKT